jgi:hypothetical protein
VANATQFGAEKMAHFSQESLDEAHHIGTTYFNKLHCILGFLACSGGTLLIYFLQRNTGLLLLYWGVFILLGGILWRNPRGGFLYGAAAATMLSISILTKCMGIEIHFWKLVLPFSVALGIFGLTVGYRLRLNRAYIVFRWHNPTSELSFQEYSKGRARQIRHVHRNSPLLPD